MCSPKRHGWARTTQRGEPRPPWQPVRKRLPGGVPGQRLHLIWWAPLLSDPRRLLERYTLRAGASGG
eukprot:2705296-Prymnesium_polylepis.2